MLTLPTSSKSLLAQLPIPQDLRILPNNIILQFIVGMTSEYRELIHDLKKPNKWPQIKTRFAQFSKSLKVENYISLYENPSGFIPLALKASFFQDIQKIINDLCIKHGYEDMLTTSVECADKVRLKAFTELALDAIMNWVGEVDNQLDEALDQKYAEDYWTNIHPTLPIDEQQKAEADAQIFACIFLFGFHNAVSVMANRESLSSLVQRAISYGPDSDQAMCRAVRVDNALRQHTKFQERYIQATNDSDEAFLRQYNLVSSPLTNKVPYPGLYFLFALLDGFGLLGKLTNPQLLDLCDLAKLDRWENRIEDAGYLGKRLNQYLAHKFVS